MLQILLNFRLWLTLVTFTTEQVEAKLAVAVAVLLPFCTVFRRSSTANLTWLDWSRCCPAVSRHKKKLLIVDSVDPVSWPTWIHVHGKDWSRLGQGSEVHMGSCLISLPWLEHKDLSWHLHWRTYHALGLSSAYDGWRCHWLCAGKAGECDVPLQQSRRYQEHGVLPQICKLCHTEITWQKLVEILYFVVYLPIQFWQNFIVLCPDKFDHDRSYSGRYFNITTRSAMDARSLREKYLRKVLWIYKDAHTFLDNTRISVPSEWPNGLHQLRHDSWCRSHNRNEPDDKGNWQCWNWTL